MLENLSYLIAILGSVAGATFFISKKLVCAERAADKALKTCDELEELIEKETKYADEKLPKLLPEILSMRMIIHGLIKRIITHGTIAIIFIGILAIIFINKYNFRNNSRIP